MIKRALYILCVLSLLGWPALAENPKREVRSVWLTTVWGLDWPASKVPAATGSNEATRQNVINSQKTSLLRLLNKVEGGNFNTIYFQVRGMSDAFYDSAYEPWSQYLSAERGADPGWDPLAFIIDEAHARGIEVHAWLNPYRYSTSAESHGNLPGDYATNHPEWLMDYGSFTKILNPGMPEVRERICDIVEDIIVKYDVDGIVFDDYFYASGTTEAMDQAQFNAYNPKGLSRGDWRRENVNMMVRDVYERISSIKPYLSFGISPAGVSASSAAVADQYGVPKAPAGSDWQYNGIFSDPLAWYKAGSVDYVSPQIYWTIGSGNDYSKLSPWWANVANFFGRYYYSSNTGSFSPTELLNQIQINRDADLNGTTGSVYFKTSDLSTASMNAMKAGPNSTFSLGPAYGWKEAAVHGLVYNLALTGKVLSWNYSASPVRFAVYAIPMAHTGDDDIYFSPKYLLGVSYSKEFTLPSEVSTGSHKIAVSVYDRFGNEFPPRVLGESVTTAKAAQLTYPANGQEVVLPALFSWKAVSGASHYIWELAEDAAFTRPIVSREVKEPEFNSGLVSSMKDNTVYHWRVKVIKPNANLMISEVRSFQGVKFKITSPADGSERLPMTPSFSWNSIGEGASYTLEISSRPDFSALAYSETLSVNSHTVPGGKLSTSTAYYARVRATKGDIQAISERIRFTTESVPIPVPEILSPATGSSIFGSDIDLSWKEQASKGFRAELSKSSGFPVRGTTVKTVEAFEFNVVFDNLQADTYYLRVRARNEDGLTDPSEPVMVVLKTPTGVKEIAAEKSKGLIYYDHDGAAILLISSDDYEDVELKFYTVTGVLLGSKTAGLNPGENRLSLNKLVSEKGLYIINVKTDREELSFKFKNEP